MAQFILKLEAEEYCCVGQKHKNCVDNVVFYNQNESSDCEKIFSEMTTDSVFEKHSEKTVENESCNCCSSKSVCEDLKGTHPEI